MLETVVNHLKQTKKQNKTKQNKKQNKNRNLLDLGARK